MVKYRNCEKGSSEKAMTKLLHVSAKGGNCGKPQRLGNGSNDEFSGRHTPLQSFTIRWRERRRKQWERKQ